MKKSDMNVYKERMLAVRSRLRGDVSELANAALHKARSESNGDAPIHMADVGSDAYEQEFTLSLMENDEETLEMIEAAIERIEDGIYGQCVGEGVRSSGR